MANPYERKAINKFKAVIRGDGSDAFAPNAGECIIRDGNIVTSLTGAVAVYGVVMTDELQSALGATSAQAGKIRVQITDKDGQEYTAFIETKYSW